LFTFSKYLLLVHEADFCEHGNEFLGSIKGGEFLDQLSHFASWRLFSSCNIAFSLSMNYTRIARNSVGTCLWMASLETSTIRIQVQIMASAPSCSVYWSKCCIRKV